MRISDWSSDVCSSDLQSLMMPLFWKGRLVCWLSATVHEGENGSCEPGGMPAAAESKYDDGLKMPPFRVVENLQIRRDIQTFLQNSEIGRARCRERVCEYVCISVVTAELKKKKA